MPTSRNQTIEDFTLEGGVARGISNVENFCFWNLLSCMAARWILWKGVMIASNMDYSTRHIHIKNFLLEPIEIVQDKILF